MSNNSLLISSFKACLNPDCRNIQIIHISVAWIWDLPWKSNKARTVTCKLPFLRLGLYFARAWNSNSLTRPLIPSCGANEAFRRPNSRREADIFSASLYNLRFDFELRIARLLGSHFAFGLTYYLSNKWDVESRRIYLWRHCDTKFTSRAVFRQNRVRTTRDEQKTTCVSADTQQNDGSAR